MADRNNDFDALLEGTSLGSRGARELRARTPAYRARAVQAIASAGWWDNYSDGLPNWFPTYFGLENVASLVRSYEVQFVHGLLQTEAYAHAVIRGGMKRVREADVERHLTVRLERQKRLFSENALELHVVLDEGALRRPYGDRRVMRDQLQHLIEMSELPNVRLQIMPFSFGGHSGESGAFTILSFPEGDVSDVVYVEQLASALYVNRPVDVSQYERAMKELQQHSPGPAESRDLLCGLVQLS
ncbi:MULTISPECIES: Scr1 family TA system antitoxin-like transcriptional regulator [Streptomyces]|jgi:hypothetical protein|uniref:DUF5753 domain-containing protein n=1 Tax=Streptomyces TaxID=1883 RepID=UPI0036E7036F